MPIHFEISESSLVKDYRAEGRKTEGELISYAKNNRDKIIGASLRISQEHIKDGCPEYQTGVSRFDVWRQYVLNTVYHTCDKLGMDYLLNQSTIKAKIEADPESQNRATLWKAILDVIGVDEEDANKSYPFFCGIDENHGIFELASHFDKVGMKQSIGHDLLGEYLSGNTERSRMTQLGIYFRDVAMGKIHYGWKLVKHGTIRVGRAPRTSYQLILVNTDKFYTPGTEQWRRPTDPTEDNPLDEVPF